MTYARLSDGPEEAIRAALGGDSAGLVVTTSGSTGAPREVLLGTDALRASAEATHARLSGPGRWLLALPPDRIAGAQVLLRSLIAETTPVVLPPGPFDAPSFATGASALVATTDPGVPLYTSLVPTQLHRLLATPEGLAALEPFSAVLVGGAPLGPADSRPTTIVETYGATETAGGCVYDGIPLEGVRVEVDDTGRISIGGAVVADGYADGDNASFGSRDGVRWFRSSDVGAWEAGSLRVMGRADDVIISGGYKVHPAVVERAILGLPGVDQAVVIGLPDSEWGTRVVALVVTAVGSASQTTRSIREALSGALPRFALPREVRSIRELPLLESGKIDRAAARAGALERETE